jgi:hypothetical protein
MPSDLNLFKSALVLVFLTAASNVLFSSDMREGFYNIRRKRQVGFPCYFLLFKQI